MSKCKMSIILMALLTTLSVSASPMIPLAKVAVPYALKPAMPIQQDDVNFVAVNPLIQSIVMTILQSEDQVQSVDQAFDPKLSSIPNERIVYDVKASVKNAQWSGGHGTAQIVTHVDFKADRVSPLPGISMTSSTTVQTQVMDLTHYAAITALQKLRGPDPVYGDRIKALLNRAAVVGTVSDLYQILVESQALTVENISYEIKKEVDYRNCLEDMRCGDTTVDQNGNRVRDNSGIAYSEGKISRFYARRASFESITLALNPSRDLITVKVPAPQGFFTDSGTHAQAKLATVNLGDSVGEVSIDGFCEESIDTLNRTRNEFLGTLNGLTAGTPDSRADMDARYRKALQAFKKAIATTDIH